LYRESAGLAAWIIEGKDLTNCIIGTIHTPGTGANHSAFQSEATGLLGIILTIKALQDTRFMPPWFQIACDGKSVLLWVQSHWPILPMEPHADLLIVVQSLSQACHYKIKWNYVRGHQDSKKTMVLMQDVWLSIEVNALAKQKLDPLWVGP